MVTIVDKIPFFAFCDSCKSKLQYEEEDKVYFDKDLLLNVYHIVCPKCGNRIYKA